MRSRLESEGLSDRLEVSSAGTWAKAGRAATPTAREAMAELDLDIRDHRSRNLDAAMMEEADLVLVMTQAHRESLTVEFPRLAHKLRLISELQGGEWDLLDPVGQPLDRYRATRDELRRLIDLGWATIVGNEEAR